MENGSELFIDHGNRRTEARAKAEAEVESGEGEVGMENSGAMPTTGDQAPSGSTIDISKTPDEELAKMADYPLPTPEIGKMTPPVPPTEPRND